MKILIKDEANIIKNSDIRWYLSDGSLWISKEETYQDVEKKISEAIGSFNWLYNTNDTILFEKNSGKFILSIIGLSSDISIVENKIQFVCPKSTGDIFLNDKNNSNFAFQGSIEYSGVHDYLLSCPEQYVIDSNICELSITTDFSFYISDYSLVGWILKNASKHLYISNTLYENVYDEKIQILLAEYLKIARELEILEDECEIYFKVNDLKKLFNVIDSINDIRKEAIKEGILAILEWYQ